MIIKVLILGLLVPGLAWNSALAQTATAPPQAETAPQPAYKFILDYDVPESPAFVVLGVTPEKVTTGGASKPIVVNLLNQAFTGGEATAGVALDFSPYFVFGGRFENINEYRNDGLKQRLANTVLSFATVQDATDSTHVRFGVGARMTLFDDHDPLQNAALTDRIAKLLTPAELDVGRESSTGIDSITGLALAYRQITDSIRSTPGRALSIGWGMAGTARGGVLATDSIGAIRHRFWAGYRETFRGGVEFLGTTQVGGGTSTNQSFRVGGALRANIQSVRLAGELVYDSETGQVHPGGVAVVKVVPQFDIIASLGSDADATGSPKNATLRFRTMLRWNFSQGGVQ